MSLTNAKPNKLKSGNVMILKTEQAGLGLATLLLLGAVGTPVQAAFVTVSGNACTGVLGTFPNCEVDPADWADTDLVLGDEPTPLIAKFEGFDEVLEGDAAVPVFEGGLFDSIDGTEFAFTYNDDGTSGTWSYTPGMNDPLITAFFIKGGQDFNLFDVQDVTLDAGTYIGTWVSPGGAISNAGFFDTDSGGGQMPVPAPLALIAAGSLVLGWSRRRRAGPVR
jgi:hypothetical protein